MSTLVLVFKKIENEDKTKYDTFYSTSKVEIIINESDIDDVFKSVCTKIISNTQKPLGKSLGWIIDGVIDHTTSISMYNPIAGSSYIKSPKQLNHPRKTLINIQNIDDNEWFRWCLVRYLNPADHNPARITKADIDFVQKLDFKDVNLLVKVSDIHKIENKTISSTLVLLVMKIKKNIQSMYQENVKKNKLIYY